MADGVGEHRLERDALGAQLVHAPPHGGAAQRARADVGGQPRDVVELGAEHVPPVVALHEQHVRELEAGGDLHPGLDAAQLDAQLLDAHLEQAGDHVRRKARHEREPGLQRGELAHGGGEQLGEPVLELVHPGGGDLVDRPLRATALAGRLPAADELVLLERLDHGVQRPVVELDAVLLAPRAEGRGDLVRVHGPLAEAAQHGEGQQIGHPATAQRELLGSDYSIPSIPGRAVAVKRYAGGARSSVIARKPVPVCGARLVMSSLRRVVDTGSKAIVVGSPEAAAHVTWGWPTGTQRRPFQALTAIAAGSAWVVSTTNEADTEATRR